MDKQLVRKGNELLLEGRLWPAIDVYTFALQNLPAVVSGEQQAQVRASRALAYFHQELYKQAMHDCSEAIALHPSCWSAYLCKAACLRALGRRQHFNAFLKRLWQQLPHLDGDPQQIVQLKTLNWNSPLPAHPATLLQPAGVAFSSSSPSSCSCDCHGQRESRPTVVRRIGVEGLEIGAKRKDILLPNSVFFSKGGSKKSVGAPPLEEIPGARARLLSTEPYCPPALQFHMSTSTPMRPQPSLVAHTAAPQLLDSPADNDTAGDPQQRALSKIDVPLDSNSSSRTGHHGASTTLSGDPRIDQVVALGYLFVNSGNYDRAVTLFSRLLYHNDRIIGAYLGRGSARALQGDFDGAVADFGRAIDIEPNCDDAYKRRGQTRSAMDMEELALADLSKAIELRADYEGHYQRGLVYYKGKNYRRAIADFKAALSYEPRSANAWNYIGICENVVGNPRTAIAAHERAIAIDPAMKEAHINIAAPYKDLGDAAQADALFTKALQLEPGHVHAHFMRGLTRLAMGRHAAARADFAAALHGNARHDESAYLLGVASHALGQLRSAVAEYEQLLAANPANHAYYQRELALYWHHRLDRPLDSFSVDAELNPYFKERACKRESALLPRSWTAQPHFNPLVADVEPLPPVLDAPLRRLVDAADRLGVHLQLNAEGYCSNPRQYRMCGLAIIHVAQTLKLVWQPRAPHPSGDPMLPVVDGAGSSAAPGGEHPFSWRDMFDILVRYRQFAEPNDPVFWVDRLSPEQFNEGFGSHTPLITGQTNVVRYYPMFERSFAIVKQLLSQQYRGATAFQERIAAARNCAELYALMGKDFWVVTTCHSVARPKHVMEGTRLTLQYVKPEGFEYSIRTPGTPHRWEDYTIEFDLLWKEICLEAQRQDRNVDKLSEMILVIAFFWYNFMPLSRGTAACGTMAIWGMFLALDIEITGEMPRGFQPDWEGILTSRCPDFVAEMAKWVYPARQTTDILDQLPPVKDTVGTLRQYIQFLDWGINDPKAQLSSSSSSSSS